VEKTATTPCASGGRIKILFSDIEFNGDSLNLNNQSIHFPSVEILRVSNVKQQVLKELMQMTPNVKTLLIMDWRSFQFDADAIVSFEDIAIHVPKLEHFGWQLQPPGRHLDKLEAVITGLPANLCKKFARKLLEQNHLSANEIAACQRQRSRPSILDLKGKRWKHCR